jgi:hypothetical protein
VKYEYDGGAVDGVDDLDETYALKFGYTWERYALPNCRERLMKSVVMRDESLSVEQPEGVAEAFEILAEPEDEAKIMINFD